VTVWKRAGREPRHLIQEWHAELQRLATRRGDRVEMRTHRYWIAFRSRRQQRAFAEIRPSRRRIEVFILPERRALVDPSGIARSAPRTQGWNWFRTKFSVVGDGKAKAALSLLRQSYMHDARADRRARARVRDRQTRLD